MAPTCAPPCDPPNACLIILIWSRDQRNSVWSHTHKEVFFNNKEEIDKKDD